MNSVNVALSIRCNAYSDTEARAEMHRCISHHVLCADILLLMRGQRHTVELIFHFQHEEKVTQAIPEGKH